VTTLLAVCVMTFDRGSAKSGQSVIYYVCSLNGLDITRSYYFTMSVSACLSVLYTPGII